MRAAVSCTLILLPLLAACGPDPAETARARQAAADPPQLWSVQAVDASARPGDQPIRICTDRLIRTGFINQHVAAGDQPCESSRPPVLTADTMSQRCTLNGREYAVVNRAEGDQAHDFKVTFSMTSLDDDGLNLSQVRRYRRLGACPAGWNIGDATDRYGRMAANSMR